MRAVPGDSWEGSRGRGSSLTARELRRLLDAVTPEASAGPGAEMPAAVLEGLAELIPCAGIGFFEMDPHRRGPGPTQFISFTSDLRAEDIDTHELFLRAYPDCVSSDRPQSVGPVTLLRESSGREDDEGLMAGSEYRDGYWQELLVRLPDRDGIGRWIMLVRGVGDTPFGERDQLMLSLLQPHLAAIRDRVEAQRSSVPMLTTRQIQLLRHVARGETNRQIGRHLGVTESTVRTHLEHIYARLKAHSRTEALAVASPLLRT